MLTNIFSLLVGVVGILIGIAFIILAWRTGNANEKLKSYFRWTTLGALFFTLGFATEFIPIEDYAEGIHHFLLIMAGIIFILTLVNFTDEIPPSIQRKD